MYLKLVVWPWPLLVHYQLPYLTSLSEAWMYVVPLAVLGIVTLVLLWRNDPLGYLLTSVFVILSPTSLVPIPTEIAAERRMYLPLAAFAVLFVVGGYSVVQWATARMERHSESPRKTNLANRMTGCAIIVLALVLAIMTVNRLRAYDDPIGLWADVARWQPNNSAARGNLGGLLANAGRRDEAIKELTIAVSLNPKYFDALCNLGQALTDAGQVAAAIDTLSTALKQHPDSPLALNNLGIALSHAGRLPEAVAKLRRAVEIKPSYSVAHSNLGAALAGLGRTPEAIEQFRLALQLNPNDANANNSLGMMLAMNGDKGEAIEHLEAAVRVRPEFVDAHTGLGQVLQQSGKLREAIEHYETAARLQPNSWQLHANLAQALAAADRSPDATAAAERAIEVARRGGAEARAQQVEEWLQHYRMELRRAAEAGSADSASQTQGPAAK
jgi:tetratricopeptide (TPR) repeat protein